MYNFKVPEPSALAVDPAVSSCLVEVRIRATLANPEVHCSALCKDWRFPQWNRSLLTRIDLPSGWLMQLVGTGTPFWVGAAVSLVELEALARGCTTGWPPWSTLGWSCLDCSSGYVQGKTAQSSSPPPLFDRVGCLFCAMALQEPLGFETQQPPTLVAPPLITGLDNAWLTVSHGNAILPFVVSRPNDDSGEANAVVLLLPGCGHFCLKNIHPLE